MSSSSSDHPGKFSVLALASQFSSLTSSSKNTTPACGVKAKNWKFYPKNPPTSSSKIMENNNSFKSPIRNLPSTSSDPDFSKYDLDDATNQYDAPWGDTNQLQFKSFAKKLLMTSSVFGNLPTNSGASENNAILTDTHKSIGSQSSTDDSGIYDEPWDASRNLVGADVLAPASLNRFGALCEARTSLKKPNNNNNKNLPDFQAICRPQGGKNFSAASSNNSAPAAMLFSANMGQICVSSGRGKTTCFKYAIY